MNILNRRELVVTFSMQEQVKIQDVLESHGIRFYRRTVDILGAKARRWGTSDLNLIYDCQSIFYVHKRDLERAKSLIQ